MLRLLLTYILVGILLDVQGIIVYTVYSVGRSEEIETVHGETDGK